MKTHHLATAALILAAISIAASAEAPQPAVKADMLVKSSEAWNGRPYGRYPEGQAELTVLHLTIPAHTTLPWHKHPMPNAAYILSGHLTVEDRATGEKRVVEAGEALAEQVGTEHRGVTDDEPCSVIVTYAGTPGLPTSISAPGEKQEY
ncbi:quercetin dioxygenase-like cupin family protein [Rhodoblastus acidophilus]|uniref:cupin domain-containing protein n=1 Tax=Rhodoblastus acidophilus TaxID=1074 RepID=UPI002225B06D|nr:cupin domain-containing protein [Rhodoblastus acidophilus]MCW2318774.1 quercetin dioxygenase-like cupin family protein [Rhodoblastus acidophilus]